MPISELMSKKSQDHFNVALGNYQSISQDGNSWVIECAIAKIQVQLMNSRVVRIRAIALNRVFEDHSYAVTAEAQPTNYTWEDNDTNWRLITRDLTLVIEKSPLRFKLHSPDGKPLVEDDPAFGISFVGHEISCYKKLRADEKFIGLGEKTGFLNRRGKWYEHWNTDAFAYGEEEDPLYLSTPFYMGITEGKTYGIFLDNSYKSVFNFGASTNRFSYFQVPDGELDYYMFAGDSVSQIISDYSWLTGKMPIPPKWSLGYQQCRYSYYPDKEVLNVARTFREKNIPCDVIYLDIHYMDQYKVFTWNNKEFPNPAAFIQELKAMGFQVVIILDPGIKEEKGYQAYDELVEQGLFVAYPDGTPYTGEVWPGTCLFPDFTNPKTRSWWGSHFEENVKLGIEGFWNDMNEPVTWGKKIPDLIEFEFEGFGATHRKAHNVYGFQMARSSYEGAKELMTNKRPFILTRAGFSGIQRYAAVWTGDNSASDEHMLMGIRLLASMGLAGIPFTGMDVGGFVGEASPRLYTRWMQICAFTPFYRGHTMINSRDSEPWSYGEEAEEISRNFIRLRYRLMPYLYSLFYEAAQTGIPIVRSLAIDYTFDEEVYNRSWSNQFMFGSSILVAAINSWQPIQKVYLPEGNWYALFNDKFHAGKNTLLTETPAEVIPVFVKAGAIFPALAQAGANVSDQSNILCLHVYAGSGEHHFTLYDDDGNTFDNEKGAYLKRTLSHFADSRTIVLAKKEGSFRSTWTHLRVYVHGTESAVVHSNDAELTIKRDKHRFIEPISNFDPFFVQSNFPFEQPNLLSAEFEWSDNEITLHY